LFVKSVPFLFHVSILSELSATDERVTSGMIVFEEFCKELAAISFVKHHFISF